MCLSVCLQLLLDTTHDADDYFAPSPAPQPLVIEPQPDDAPTSSLLATPHLATSPLILATLDNARSSRSTFNAPGNIISTANMTSPLLAAAVTQATAVPAKRSAFSHLMAAPNAQSLLKSGSNSVSSNTDAGSTALSQQQQQDKKSLMKLTRMFAEHDATGKPLRRTRRQYRQYTDEQLNSALRDIKAGMNRSKAARMYGVPETSLRREEVRRLASDYKKY